MIKYGGKEETKETAEIKHPKVKRCISGVFKEGETVEIPEIKKIAKKEGK